MEMKNISFSIVIPTYNSSSMLRRCLQSIQDIAYQNYEVIVVDDGSTDDTPEMISQFDGIRYFRQENQGPAAARNLGFHEAKGDLILFTDSDCVLPNDILSQYLKIFNSHQYAGVGGSYRTLNIESNVARYVGYEIGFRHSKMKKQEVKAFGSYNAVFRKEILMQHNGFDTTFKTASGEDFDLCYRITEQGATIGFASHIYVYHEHPDSLKKYLKQQVKRGESRLINVLKNKRNAISDNYVEKGAKWQPFIILAIILTLFIIPFFTYHGVVIFFVAVFLLIHTNLNLFKYIFIAEPKILPLTILISLLKPVAWLIGSLKHLFFIVKSFLFPVK